MSPSGHLQAASSLSPGGLLPSSYQPFDPQGVDRLSSAKSERFTFNSHPRLWLWSQQ
jgi:hypothetical protein